MGEYLFTLVSVSLVIGAASFLISHEERASRFAVGALLLYAVLFPIVKAAGNIDFGSVMSPPVLDTEGGEYELVAKRALEDGIRDAVCEKFSISGDDVRVTAHGFDFEKMKAQSISLVLSGRAIFKDIEKIEKFVSSLECGICEVEIEL